MKILFKDVLGFTLHNLLEYSSEICDQTNCRLKAKPIGVESYMA